MEFLYNMDKAIFYFFNRTLANPFFDWLMPWVTEESHWYIPIALVWIFLLLWGGRKGRKTAFLVVLILLVTDQSVNFIIKPWVHRVRPCFVLENVRLLIRQPHSHSFPSSHAANISAMAFLFSIQYRKYWMFFAGFALLISLSRIFVGVHYPSDVAGGMLIGVFLSGVIIGSVCKIYKMFETRQQGKKAKIQYEKTNPSNCDRT